MKRVLIFLICLAFTFGLKAQFSTVLDLKNYINTYIKANGTSAITGAQANTALIGTVNFFNDNYYNKATSDTRFAFKVHTHVIGNITGLQDSINALRAAINGVSTATYTFSNGVTNSAGAVKLGGTLTQGIVFTGGLQDITFNNIDAFSISGNNINLTSQILNLKSNQSSINTLLSLQNNAGNEIVSIRNDGRIYSDKYRNTAGLDSIAVFDVNGNLINVYKGIITGTSYTAGNGLTLSAATFKIGGGFTENTTVSGRNLRSFTLDSLNTMLTNVTSGTYDVILPNMRLSLGGTVSNFGYLGLQYPLGSHIYFSNPTVKMDLGDQNYARFLLSRTDTSANISGKYIHFNTTALSTNPPLITQNIYFDNYKNNIALDSILSTTIDGRIVNRLSPNPTGVNVGTGAGIFRDKVGNSINFRTIIGGNNMTAVQNANDITISGKSFIDSVRRDVGTDQVYWYINGNKIFAFKDSTSSPGAGEANTASNLGSGIGVFKAKVGLDLQFKSLVQGAGMTFTNNANDINIAAIPYTATNGLTLSAFNVKIGGNLSENTTIDGTSTYTYSLSNIKKYTLGVTDSALVTGLTFNGVTTRLTTLAIDTLTNRVYRIPVGTATAAGSNTWVQFKGASGLDADASFTFNKASTPKLLTVNGQGLFYDKIKYQADPVLTDADSLTLIDKKYLDSSGSAIFNAGTGARDTILFRSGQDIGARYLNFLGSTNILVTDGSTVDKIQKTFSITGIIPAANLGSGSGGATKFLREDNTWQTVSGGSGVTTMTAFGNTPNANGATIAGTNLTLQPTDATNPGGVKVGFQVFPGSKVMDSLRINYTTPPGGPSASDKYMAYIRGTTVNGVALVSIEHTGASAALYEAKSNARTWQFGVDHSLGASPGSFIFTNAGNLVWEMDLFGVTKFKNQVTTTTNAIGGSALNNNGIQLINTTAAISGTQQVSPSLTFEGQGFKTDVTAASRSVKFRFTDVPIQGTANPSGRLDLESIINNGTPTPIWSISSTGVITNATWNGVSISNVYTDAKVATVTGTANRVSVGGTGANPIIDIAGTYVGQTSITTLGTIGTGTWNGTSITTAFTDAKLRTLTGTTNRINISGPTTDPTVDISANYVGQGTITTLGTITTGIWNGTSIGTGFTDAKIKTVTGTSGNIVITGTATDPIFNTGTNVPLLNAANAFTSTNTFPDGGPTGTQIRFATGGATNGIYYAGSNTTGIAGNGIAGITVNDKGTKVLPTVAALNTDATPLLQIGDGSGILGGVNRYGVAFGLGSISNLASTDAFKGMYSSSTNTSTTNPLAFQGGNFFSFSSESVQNLTGVSTGIAINNTSGAKTVGLGRGVESIITTVGAGTKTLTNAANYYTNNSFTGGAVAGTEFMNYWVRPGDFTALTLSSNYYGFRADAPANSSGLPSQYAYYSADYGSGNSFYSAGGNNTFTGRTAIGTTVSPGALFKLGTQAWGSELGYSMQLIANTSNNPITASSQTVPEVSAINLGAIVTSATNTGIVYTRNSTIRIDPPTDGSNVTSTDRLTINSNGTIGTKKLKGYGTPPAVTVGANFTGTVSVSANSSDLAGTITLVITASTSFPTLSPLFQLTYNTAYGNTPSVIFSPANSTAAGTNFTGLYIKNSGTTLFELATVNSGTSTTGTYIYNYQVIQ